MSRYPSQQLKQFLTRFPDGMRERIKAEADANKRTMNDEIIARLERSFAQDAERGAASGPIDLVQVVKDTLEDHERRLATLEGRLTAEDAPLEAESLLDVQTAQLRKRLSHD
jgi:hypothetical protein